MCYPYWSHDIGGHFPGPVEDELYVRWIQWAAFNPVGVVVHEHVTVGVVVVAHVTVVVVVHVTVTVACTTTQTYLHSQPCAYAARP